MVGVKVTVLRWGVVRLSTGEVYKDCIVVGSDSEAWDWKKYGLSHSPGYTEQTMQPILRKAIRVRADCIIVSIGMEEAIRVDEAMYEKYKHHQIEFYNSRDAVARFNRLVDAGQRPILFLHSTC